MLRILFKEIANLLKETLSVSLELFKILIPVMVLVKLLAEFGLIDVIGETLAPLMGLVGLPGEMGIVWGAAIVTNIYGAIVALIGIQLAEPLSVAQMTVLGSMILVCHAIPVEVALCYKVGGVWRSLVFIRFFGAIIYGGILHLTYSGLGALSGPAKITWVEQRAEVSVFDWIVNQGWTLAFTMVVLFALLSMMRILKALGILSKLEDLLKPLLRLINVSAEATSIAVIGLLAGITFGSGLLLAEIRNNDIPKRDVFITLIFLSLCHGLIEDTTLMLLIGGDISGLLFGRLVFSLIGTVLLTMFFFGREARMAEAT